MTKQEIHQHKFEQNINNLKDFFSLTEEEYKKGIYSDHSTSSEILNLKVNLFGNQVLSYIYYDGRVPKIKCLNNLDLEKELNTNFYKEYYS